MLVRIFIYLVGTWDTNTKINLNKSNIKTKIKIKLRTVARSFVHVIETIIGVQIKKSLNMN